MNDPPIRPAATVMLLRPSTDGYEVLMVRRTNQAVFGGGMYVFPGGRVDDADGPGDDGFVVAAIRECFEEAGVLLARDPAGATPDRRHPVFAEREAVHGGAVSFAELLARHRLAPALDDLVWVANWLTPKGEMPRRFDTRFFVAAMPDGQTSGHDRQETVDSEWLAPAAALARWAQRDLAMLPPTVAQLRFLDRHPTVEAVFAAGRAMLRPERVEPRLIPGTWEVRLPGEPGFDELA